jgi:hypothetical protein
MLKALSQKMLFIGWCAVSSFGPTALFAADAGNSKALANR